MIATLDNVLAIEKRIYNDKIILTVEPRYVMQFLEDDELRFSATAINWETGTEVGFVPAITCATPLEAKVKLLKKLDDEGTIRLTRAERTNT